MNNQKEEKALSELLIENSAALQKVLTDVASNLRTLIDKLSSLLKLLEEAGKAVEEPEKELAKKLDTLIEQNKIVAKGLIALEAVLRETAEKPKPLPEFRF